MPKNLEVWFLSLETQASLYKKNSLVVNNSYLQCQQIGEYCFDPQVGLYKKEENTLMRDIDVSEVDNVNRYEFIDSASSLDRNLVECEKDQFFDIFCGKAKKAKRITKAKLEIWIDTSSTMKQVDGGKTPGQCHRRFLADSLNGSCKNNGLNIYSFKEFKKENSLTSDLCHNEGNNSTKNLIRDIKASNAHNLIIITDIFEAFEEFVNFVEESGGIIKGLDEKIYASGLKDSLKNLAKKCK